MMGCWYVSPRQLASRHWFFSFLFTKKCKVTRRMTKKTQRTSLERIKVLERCNILGRHEGKTNKNLSPWYGSRTHYLPYTGGILLGPVQTYPFSFENEFFSLRFQNNLSPQVAFSNRFRPSTRKRLNDLKTLIPPTEHAHGAIFFVLGVCLR